MKKLFLALAALLFLAPAALSAQGITTKTYFAGERITGVSTSSYFVVTLVKSSQTRAVIEMNEMSAPYLQISRDGAGVVSVGMRNMNKEDRRDFDRLPGKDKITRLTLYLPSLNTVRMSGFSSLTTEDEFEGNDLDVMVTGHSSVRGRLSIASTRAKVQCSGFSTLENLTLGGTADLIAIVSGHSTVGISARRTETSKVGVSGFSTLRLSGAGERGEWTVDGHSKLLADEFTIREMNLGTSGFSNAKATVAAAGKDMTVVVSSNSEVDITARGVGFAKIDTFGFCTTRISGDGARGEMSASSHADLRADGFALREAKVSAVGFSTVKVWASESLTTETSNRGSVQYRGTPARINNSTESVRPL